MEDVIFCLFLFCYTFPKERFNFLSDFLKNVLKILQSFNRKFLPLTNVVLFLKNVLIKLFLFEVKLFLMGVIQFLTNAVLFITDFIIFLANFFQRTVFFSMEEVILFYGGRYTLLWRTLYTSMEDVILFLKWLNCF